MDGQVLKPPRSRSDSAQAADAVQLTRRPAPGEENDRAGPWPAGPRRRNDRLVVGLAAGLVVGLADPVLGTAWAADSDGQHTPSSAGLRRHRLRSPDRPSSHLKKFAPSDDKIGVLLAAWRHETNRLPPQRPGLRDRQAFEGVRMQAGALFAAGHSQAEVARKLGVARQNVSRWHALWRTGGLQALASRGPTGYAPRLSEQQLHRIDQALRQGARAHGFDNDHWTLDRVAAVIQRLTGVSYHRGHIWKLLRHRLHYRLLRPARRAVERDERAIARWVAEDWP
jgi:transposase